MKDYQLDDSGAREEHPTGAVRDVRQGKGRFDLITPIGLLRLAGVYERGAVKYKDRNWEKGMPLSRFLDSAERHINDYKLIKQYERDKISFRRLPENVNPNEDHLAQAVWNLFCIMHFEWIRHDLDDLGCQAIVKPENQDVDLDERPELLNQIKLSSVVKGLGELR